MNVGNLREKILVKNVTELTQTVVPAFCEKTNEIYDKPLDWLNESSLDLLNQFFDINQYKPNTILKHSITDDYLAYSYKLNSTLTGLSGYSMVIEHQIIHPYSLSTKELSKIISSKKGYISDALKTRYVNYLRRINDVHILKIRPMTNLVWKSYKMRYINPQNVELYKGMDKYDWISDSNWDSSSNSIFSLDKDSLPILMFSEIVDGEF